MRYKLSVAAAYAATLGWLAYYPAPSQSGSLALPVAVLIAVPAGYGSDYAEIPIWFVTMFMSLLALPAIVVGWAARWFVTRNSSR